MYDKQDRRPKHGMFGRLRDSTPEGTLLRCGIASWALAGLLLAMFGSLPLAGFPALVGTGCLVGWGYTVWNRRKAERYDLRRLWDTPPPDPEEPLTDTIPANEEAVPYCGWCDEAHAPGTYRCTRCGRPLA